MSPSRAPGEHLHQGEIRSPSFEDLTRASVLQLVHDAWGFRGWYWKPAMFPSCPAIRALRPSRTVVLVFAAVACRGPDTRFVERFSPDFDHPRHTISVFGVFKNGQMSSEAWNALRPHIEPLVGAGECEAAFGPALASADGRLLRAIDDYTRANGPTDDLLARIAPAAEGDLVLVLVEAGHPPAPEKKVTVQDTSTQRRSRQTVNHGGLSDFKPRSGGAADQDVLDLSASLFSVAKGTSVAVVDMQYEGPSLDEAVERFAARLARALPEAKCRGWRWNVNVDPQRIRDLGGE